MRNFIDKVFRRFALVLLEQVDRRQLHPKRILLEEAQRESAEYARQNMTDALIFDRREEVFDLALSRMPTAGMVLEFGVANGDSIRYLATRTKRTINGFDSFKGLPDDWPGRHEERGHYSTGGRLPCVPGNVSLHKGLFCETLPTFLKSENDPVALLHIDCDLYQSTKFVLNTIVTRLKPGTLIIFDEYFNFIGWREHEFKAFQELMAETGLSYRYLAWSYQQVVVVIQGEA